MAIARGLAKDVRGRATYLYSDGIYWVLRLFWLNLDKGLRWLPWPSPQSKPRAGLELGGRVLSGIIRRRRTSPDRSEPC